ncbi:hypothetical protein NXK52_003458 [Vibrio cholerae]|nr:hypothetical protein [Vibrio cholerae]EJL6442227.1 hypothetical protein [Vibrio cholerae]EJR6827023.1 hypothetical protein [Vibrio cholerae]EKF9086012.1 hypothetical protein [Vibrio cholerae]
MISEVKGQRNWQDYGLKDLREINQDLHLPFPKELKKAESIEDAIALVAKVFSLLPDDDFVAIDCCIGQLIVQRNNIEHIVEKRNDARERYAPHALATIKNPFEVWEVMYEKEERRYAFIGLFAQKRQMLVIVSIQKDNVLWNFMHTDKKRLNKHRHGQLIYPTAEKQKAANE